MHVVTTTRSQNWCHAPWYKQAVLAVVFLAAFLLLDGSSAPATQWGGAPACYFPVGLSVALLLAGGIQYSPLIVLASILAAYMRCIVAGMDGYVAKPISGKMLVETVEQHLRAMVE
jgi:integral membrane sensor domain MASE1